MRSIGLLIALAVASACVSSPQRLNDASARIAGDVAVAVAVRELGEVRARYGDNHPEVVRLKSAQASLVASGTAASPDFQNDLVDALRYEMAVARRENAELAMRYGESHLEMKKSAAGIAALTAALGDAAR